MSKLFDGMTDEEDFVLQWQYRYCGGFNRQLAELICKADLTNRERIRKGFPMEVSAMEKYLELEGWWFKVQQKAVELGHLNLSQV